MMSNQRAILAEQFLEYFDGFSIGSNDMTQLTLGLDRGRAWSFWPPTSTNAGQVHAEPHHSGCLKAGEVRGHLRPFGSHLDLALAKLAR